MTKRFSSMTISQQVKFLPMEGSLKPKRDPYEYKIKFKITNLFNPIKRTLIHVKGYFINVQMIILETAITKDNFILSFLIKAEKIETKIVNIDEL